MRKLLIVVLLLSAAILPAQSASKKQQGKDELRFTLILSRHGIRPPLTPTSKLNQYATDPWPEWEVPLGYLTPHGAKAIHQLGAFLRTEFAEQGQVSATGCPSDADIYIYTDTDQRNIMSSYFNFEGFEPGCKPRAMYGIAPDSGVRDVLFSPVPFTFPGPSKKELEADKAKFLGMDLDTYASAAKTPELNELAKILAPDPARQPKKPLLKEPRPLALGNSLTEDIFLEYINNRPLSEVGWGRVDYPTLRRLLQIHAKSFALATRMPLTAKVRGSNLLEHMLNTLDQAQSAKPVSGAIGPTGTRIVYVSGHDSNLFAIAGLLNLHWNYEDTADDTPPDSHLAFELWQNTKTKKMTVRVLFRAQTIEQLRAASPLSKENKPVEVVLTPVGCKASKPCSYEDFKAAANKTIDKAYTAPLKPLHLANPGEFMDAYKSK